MRLSRNYSLCGPGALETNHLWCRYGLCRTVLLFLTYARKGQFPDSGPQSTFHLVAFRGPLPDAHEGHLECSGFLGPGDLSVVY